MTAWEVFKLCFYVWLTLFGLVMVAGLAVSLPDMWRNLTQVDPRFARMMHERSRRAGDR